MGDLSISRSSLLAFGAMSACEVPCMTRVSTLELLVAEEGGEDEYAHLRPKLKPPQQSARLQGRVNPAPSADALATMVSKIVDSEARNEYLAHARGRVLATREQIDSAWSHFVSSTHRASMLPTTVPAPAPVPM